MKRIVDYLMFFLLLCLSVGQIVFVLFDTQFAATEYDKLTTLLSCVPLFFLPITTILVQRYRKNKNEQKAKKLLLFQIIIFCPCIIVEIMRVINAMNSTNIILLNNIVDIAIIVFLPFLLLMLLLKKKKAYIIGKILIVLLIIIACCTEIFLNFESKTSAFILSLLIYAVSVYPILSLKFEMKTND